MERFSRGVGAFQELETELAGFGLLERRDKIEAVIERRGSFNDQKAKEWAESHAQNCDDPNCEIKRAVRESHGAPSGGVAN